MEDLEDYFEAGPFSFRHIFRQLARMDTGQAMKFFDTVMERAVTKEPKMGCCKDGNQIVAVVVMNIDTDWFTLWSEGSLVSVGYCHKHFFDNGLTGKRIRRAFRSFHRSMNGLLIEAEKLIAADSGQPQVEPKPER